MGTEPWANKDNAESNPSHPVNYVTWNDVSDFVSRLNDQSSEALFRLPTEAEWEYACRASSNTLWPFGDDPTPLGEYAWYFFNAWDKKIRYPQPVGLKTPNSWGFHDMLGNVAEMCQDWWSDQYVPEPDGTDPKGPDTGNARVIRGGSFHFVGGNTPNVRSASRFPVGLNYTHPGNGFRILMQLELGTAVEHVRWSDLKSDH